MHWKKKVYWVLDVIGGIVLTQFFNYISVFLSAVYYQSMLPSTVDMILGIIGICLILVVIGLTSHGLYGLKRWRNDRKYFDRVQAYLFFPANTPERDKTLEYHKKNFHHKLMVNFKTRPHKAYRMSMDSYGWKLVKRYSDLWVPEIDPTPHGDQSIESWCKEKGYKLIPRNADKKDLLERDKIVSKLNRLNDFEVEWLFPWHYQFRSSDRRGKPPDKRLLLKISTKETFDPPWTGDKERTLIRNGSIRKQNFIMRPWHFGSVKIWSWCNRYKYRRHYTGIDLLEGV